MKVIFCAAAIIITLAFLTALTSGIVAYFVLIPYAQHYMATPAPTATPVPAAPTSLVQAWTQTTHHVMGKVFDDNQHSVLITTDHGNQDWTYTGAAGDYNAYVQSDALSYMITIYDNTGSIVYSDEHWRSFSRSGTDVVNVDSSNR